jgi:DNA-binding CsgD family transcriptional regulator
MQLRSQIVGLAKRHRVQLGDESTRQTLRGESRLAGLTGRELEVLRLIAHGLSNNEIAGSLSISPKTVSVHVSHILAKLDVPSRSRASAIAHEDGIP